MRGAPPYTQPNQPPPPVPQGPVHGRQLVTGRSFPRIVGALVVSGLILGVAAVVVLKMSQAAATAPAKGETPATRPYQAKRTYPPMDEQAVVAKPTEDPNAKRWDDQARINKAVLAALE